MKYLLNGTEKYLVSDKDQWTSYKTYPEFINEESSSISEASILENLPLKWREVYENFEFFIDEVADVSDITLWQKAYHAPQMAHMEATTSQH